MALTDSCYSALITETQITPPELPSDSFFCTAYEQDMDQVELRCHQCGSTLCNDCEQEIPRSWGAICSEDCLLENRS